MKSLLLVLAAGLGLALFTAAPAAAKTPCGRAVINDWFDNGRVDQKYPPHCYRDAIHQLPPDVQTYSDAADEIQRALLAVLRGNDGGGGGKGAENTMKAHANGNGGENDRSVASSNGRSSSDKPSNGIIQSTLEWLGPSNAASVPLPLLVLAGVAFLLLAVAGGSMLNRRLHERRLPPPQA